MIASGVTVQGNLDALQEQRNREWPPEQVAAHKKWRESIEAAAERDQFVKVGDVVEPFTLPEVDGGEVDLLELLATAPVVLIFFRFESCPACNAALPAYRDALAPALNELGVHLVAVSPQVPGRLIAIKHRLGIEFPVASDQETRLIHAFGVAFAPDEEEQERQRRDGGGIAELLGNGKWELPHPTVVVIDQLRVVRFADVHPDWMVRTEADAVVQAVSALVPARSRAVDPSPR